MKMLISKKKILLASAMLTFAGGWHYAQIHDAHAQGGAAGQAPQAMPVTIDVVNVEEVQIWNNYSARLEAVDFVDIRPQVSGKITEVKFKDGQEVEKGDVLYVIDVRPYQASVDQARAELSVAKNQASLTKKEMDRAKDLIKTNAISTRVLDERTSAYNVAAASVKSAQARLDRATIDLDYAHVTAPISGRVGRVEVKKGNLVSAGANAPLLTSIVSLDGIYADFDVDEQSYLKYIRSNARDRAAENAVPVRLLLGDGDVEYDGFIYSFDNQIDASSGTIRARAFFANEDRALLPGMFVSVKMGTAEADDKILVSERAIGTDQDRKFVYVVGDGDIVEYRTIKIGKNIDGKRVVLSGLKAGDRVITEGIIRIRPGMPVAPKVEASSPDDMQNNTVPPAATAE